MFEYLKKYLQSDDRLLRAECVYNRFYAVSDSSIERAEQLIGYKLPSELKKLYTDVGYGFLQLPVTVDPTSDEAENYCSITNHIYSPYELSRIVQYRGTSDNEELCDEDIYIHYNVLEYLEYGDLPFFEISDSSYFLYMKPLSDKPNAVYVESGHYMDLVEESLEKFIWRLYYEDPSFYDEARRKFAKS